MDVCTERGLGRPDSQNGLYVPLPAGLGMRSGGWKPMFDEFFRDGPMAGSYKPVLLDALIDAASYVEARRKRDWININGDEIRLELDFIAARFALHYWEVHPFVFRHIAQGGTGKGSAKYDLKIIKIIRKHFKAPDKIPDIKYLESPDRRNLRREIIRDAIKPYVLPNLLNDMPGLYNYKRGENHITFDAGLSAYMDSHAALLRRKIQRKLDEHIRASNKKPRPILPVENPFYLYVKNRFQNAQTKLPG